MIAVFAERSTPRLNYVLDFCFAQKGEQFELFTDEQSFASSPHIKLNYSSKVIDCDYSIDPSILLFENNLDPNLKLEKDRAKITLYGSKDPLSVVFYILSRYEEYQAHTKDEHGRFPASESQQTKLGLLHDPIVDQIVMKLWLKLGMDYKPVRAKFELVPSFDIDIAWAYKNRPLWRKLGAFKYGKFGERLGVLLFGKKDPYDTYSLITKISADLNRIICFAPVSDYSVKDKNINWKNEYYQSLIRGLNSSGGMGLHPGYHTFLNKDKIVEEKERLEQILGHEMKKSRFHFLRFDVSRSYTQMIELGFTKDYSMGYADNVGFRAGTSFPFHFFDLKNNCATDYLVFPFAYLDNAYNDYLKQSPTEALADIKNMMDEVKEVGGVFMCIWHNHSINDKGLWKDWQDVLLKTVEWGKK